jgi:hypothetical protein
MQLRFLVALAALAFVAVGPASAHYTVPTSTTGVFADFYVPDEGDVVDFLPPHSDDFHVYQEDNGCTELQEEANDPGCPEGTPADSIIVDL